MISHNKISVFNLVLPLIIFILVGCDRNKNSDSVVISGKFVFSRGETLFLKEILVYETSVLDSIILDETGEFYFKVPVKDASIFWVGTSDKNYVTLVCEKGETVELTGDIRDLSGTYQVKGSPGSEQLLALQQYTFQHYKIFDSLSGVWERRKYDKDKLLLRDTLDSIALNIYKAQEQYVKQFVIDNNKSLASILALYQIFGRVAVLDEFEYIELYEQTAQSLREKYPGNQHVNELTARVSKNKALLKEREEIAKRLLPGNPVPELSLPGMEGEPTAISEFKDYAMLIVFWSSTDPKSRKLNIDLVQLYKTYSPKGFLLYMVSFDNNIDVWKKAIALDKLPGIQVIDQRGWNSPVIKMFNIQKLPHTVLIDKQHLIVNTNLTIEQIKTELNEILFARKAT